MKEQVDALAALVNEFDLHEATWEVDGARVTLRKKLAAPVAVAAVAGEGAPMQEEAEEVQEAPVAAAPAGTPVTSPMNGIYYGSPNPSSPPFVKEGDTITAGQTIGLIEAMKVFNEVPAPMSGTVLKVVAESGQLVQPGEPLLYIG